MVTKGWQETGRVVDFLNAGLETETSDYATSSDSRNIQGSPPSFGKTVSRFQGRLTDPMARF